MSGHTGFITTARPERSRYRLPRSITMGFLRSRRPIMPLAVWAMTAALAYAAGKRQSAERKAGDRAKARVFKRRRGAPARRA